MRVGMVPSSRVTSCELSGTGQGCPRGRILRCKSTSYSGFSKHPAASSSTLCPREDWEEGVASRLYRMEGYCFEGALSVERQL